jgi:hypothetical protein
MNFPDWIAMRPFLLFKAIESSDADVAKIAVSHATTVHLEVSYRNQMSVVCSVLQSAYVHPTLEVEIGRIVISMGQVRLDLPRKASRSGTLQPARMTVVQCASMAGLSRVMSSGKADELHWWLVK